MNYEITLYFKIMMHHLLEREPVLCVVDAHRASAPLNLAAKAFAL